ncbi:MAG TPA: fumarate/nitrate reduction transcriptional regulator Fnr [Burkholderiales bacterium]|nr:fumarate/nitrate reduction transcriptional regulator Fnr [Burkholderiales bacterium]
MQTASVIPFQPHADRQPASARIACSTCNLRELCLPAGLSDADLERTQTVVRSRRRVRRGEALFRAGDAFSCVYAIRSGFFKSSVAGEEGREQVTDFHMGGELLGMDGVGTGRYEATATALEDSEVCVMPYGLIEEMSHEIRPLQRRLHAVMAREIVRNRGVMMLLGSMRAEERLAVFLLNLSQRFAARGFSRTEFMLRMTREEIGSYLGLKLETVSRTFSRFHESGLIAVQQKHIRIVDIDGLKKMIGQAA